MMEVRRVGRAIAITRGLPALAGTEIDVALDALAR
jgi:hypothetical protein